MHKNILSFWRTLENLPEKHRDKPSPRICILLQEMFEKWQSKPPWLDKDQLGHLFDHYKDDSHVRQLSVMERKGLAIKKTLEVITRDEYAYRGGTIDIHPLEPIVGTLPPFSVGQGKELMRYLNEEESLYWETQYLNEWSPFGHTVPNHEAVLKHGTSGIIEQAQQYAEQQPEKRDFYEAVINAMKGVNYYANEYADRCDRIKDTFEEGSPEYTNMASVADRLRKVPALPAETFAEAIQCIHIMHCALHYTGEIVPIGRLDQLLISYYQKDLKAKKITPEEAQEFIDAFWIKLDEKVLLNKRFAEDRFTSSDGALLGAGGPSNFDQGALLNQWMQQVTIGGTIANNDKVPKDACNEVTVLCLEASRRLPLNSPTLDLRVHSKTPDHILELAAETILSGGAHPVLLNDERIIPALHEKTGGKVELASARNYACDGCFETLFAGETEFSFGFVPAIDVLEKALNEGAGFGAAGDKYLRGMKTSYRTKVADLIGDYDEFYKILKVHLKIGAHKFFNGILNQYGFKEEVSPSPLLSAMINGCLESGRDISGGGARYKLFSPLMTGISTTADSLYVIKELVFNQKFMSLAELVSCLKSNWGNNMEITGLKLPEERIQEIRQACLKQPKFGYGNEEVDQIAWQLIEDFCNVLEEARESDMHTEQWKTLESKYGSEDRPFEILLAPGVGTFEQYVFGGMFAGATPDGRLSGTTIASDMSPSPRHTDFKIEEGETNPFKPPTASLDVALNSYKDKRVDLLSDGAPADFNIPEDFPLEDLVKAIRKFAQGDGGNIITITVASPDTFKEAKKNPQDHNLLRVRMGGWTEFFITLFPNHQNQHLRRPQYGH